MKNKIKIKTKKQERKDNDSNDRHEFLKKEYGRACDY